MQQQTQKIGLSQNGARIMAQWIQTEPELRALLNDGMNQLFRDVFGEPPYNEVFVQEEVDNIFVKYITNGANILTLREGLNGKPVGFMVGMPLCDEFRSFANMPSIFFERKTGYIAEDGVMKGWRRAGLSSFMKAKMLERLKSDGFEYAILRTRADNIPQIEAVAKAGGAVINYAQQDVMRQTKFGEVREDNRFFLFDLGMK